MYETGVLCTNKHLRLIISRTLLLLISRTHTLSPCARVCVCACSYYNNTCIQDKDGLVAYVFRFCDPNNPDNVTNLGLLHDNKIYNPSGKVTVECGRKVMTEAEFQASGADPGTTTHKTPDYSEIIGWAKKLLQK